MQMLFWKRLRWCYIIQMAVFFIIALGTSVNAKKVASDAALSDPKKCDAATSIHTSVIKSRRFPQYSKLVQLMADRGNCHLKLSDKQKGVCKQIKEFGYCCNQQYEDDLKIFFRDRECLIGLILKSSVLEGLLADMVGALPKSILRLTTAKGDVPKDVRGIYSDSIAIQTDILAKVRSFRNAAKSKSVGDSFEAVRFFIADIICGACQPALVSSVKAGDSTVMKINAAAFETLRFKVQTNFRPYIEAMASILYEAQKEDGWIDRVLSIRIQHFISTIKKLTQDLSTAGEEKLGALLHSLRTISSTYPYINEEQTEAALISLQAEAKAERVPRRRSLLQLHEPLAQVPMLAAPNSMTGLPGVATPLDNGSFLTPQTATDMTHLQRNATVVLPQASVTNSMASTSLLAPGQQQLTLPLTQQGMNSGNSQTPQNVDATSLQKLQHAQAIQLPMATQVPAVTPPVAPQIPAVAPLIPAQVPVAPPSNLLSVPSEATVAQGQIPQVSGSQVSVSQPQQTTFDAQTKSINEQTQQKQTLSGAEQQPLLNAFVGGRPTGVLPQPVGSYSTLQTSSVPTIGDSSTTSTATVDSTASNVLQLTGLPMLLAGEAEREASLATDPSKFKERVHNRLMHCAFDLGLFAVDGDNQFTGSISDHGFKEKFESSVSELTMHDFLVNFGFGPQLCLYDILVNLMAMLPDPRVDANFANSVRAENGTLLATDQKTDGGETMNNLARGIFSTLERELSFATSDRLNQEDILLMNEKGDLIRNRTLVNQREHEESDAYINAQLQIQKEALALYKKQHDTDEVTKGNSSDSVESMIQTSSQLSARNVVMEFLEKSARHHKERGSSLPASQHGLVESRYPPALLQSAISFVSLPSNDKSVLISFSNDAPDPSEASEHQRISDDLEQTRNGSQSISVIFALSLLALNSLVTRF